MKRGYWINNKGKEATIHIYEEIGKSFWSDSGIGAKQFAEDLKALGKIDVLNVRINSPGGDVFDGAAIKTQLEQHPAVKNVFIDGLAASAASYIAMAGNRIEISANALFMVHNSAGFVMGNAEDMTKMAELLTTIDGTIADMYQRRTGNPIETIKEWMAAETWMNAEQTVKNGFADAMMEEEAATEPAAAAFDLSRFKNAPKIPVVAQASALFIIDQEYRRRKLELAKART